MLFEPNVQNPLRHRRRSSSDKGSSGLADVNVVPNPLVDPKAGQQCGNRHFVGLKCTHGHQVVGVGETPRRFSAIIFDHIFLEITQMQRTLNENRVLRKL